MHRFKPPVNKAPLRQPAKHGFALLLCVVSIGSVQAQSLLIHPSGNNRAPSTTEIGGGKLPMLDAFGEPILPKTIAIPASRSSSRVFRSRQPARNANTKLGAPAPPSASLETSIHRIAQAPQRTGKVSRNGSENDPATSLQPGTPVADSDTLQVTEKPVDAGPHEIPLAAPSPRAVELTEADHGRITLIVRDATVKDILNVIAGSQGINIVCADEIPTRLSLSLERVTLEDALDVVLSVAGYTWTNSKGIVIVTSLSQTTALPAEMQGRMLEVFELNFVTAEDVAVVVEGMLSPVGTASTIVSNNANNRQTKEVIVVEDLPRNLSRVRDYICQVDYPPRQVVIEAHILAIDLKDSNRHGVNFEHLFSPSSNIVSLRSQGLANPSAPQAFFFQLSGGNLTSLVEMLRSTSDAKTLAQPRVQVLNGQRARLQVGQQLGFRVTTTTQTSTTQGVQFLNVGVILEITPRISNDGRILLEVSPEVSSGRVNSETGLPEQETTNLETDVLLSDGQGIVIAGLIKETDTNVQTKLPFFGDLKWVGSIFTRRELEKRRVEIIITLLPRIAPFDPDYQHRQNVESERAHTPLLQPCLTRHPRPWEAWLPDTLDNPRVFRLPRFRDANTAPQDLPSTEQSQPTALPHDLELGPQQFEVLPPWYPAAAPTVDPAIAAPQVPVARRLPSTKEEIPAHSIR